MELRHIRYFVAVAEELHFGHAAQRLRISQPPLSQQIKALEEEVGARLFERTKHRVRLTRAGEAMLVEAYRLLEQAERVRTTARRANAGLFAHLKIGCVPSAFFGILPPILDALHARHPEIGLSLSDYETGAAVTALLQGRLDVGFFRLDRVDGPLRLRPLMSEHFIAALPHRHALTRHKRIPLTSLAAEPLIIFSRHHSPRPHDAIIAACLKAGFSPNLEYQSDSIQSQIGLVACGLGIALVPSVTQRWRIPRVTYRELDNPIPATDLSVVWNGATKSPPVELFLQTVQQVFRAPARRTAAPRKR